MLTSADARTDTRGAVVWSSRWSEAQSAPSAPTRWPTRAGAVGAQLQHLVDEAADQPGSLLVGLIRIADREPITLFATASDGRF